MDDLISRQAAIDALIAGEPYGIEYNINKIRELPPAQAEIVRCKDCKEWTQTAGDEEFSIGRCEFLGHDFVMNKGFCAWGVRKDDADK